MDLNVRDHKPQNSQKQAGSILYDPPPRVTETKTKVSKWGLIKLTSFCTAKETKQGEKTALRMGENNSK